MILTAALLLAACDNPYGVSLPEERTVEVTVIEAPTLDTRGRAIWQGDKCTIFLREYPLCLGHEMMHCLSGSWHEEIPNDDYCDI